MQTCYDSNDSYNCLNLKMFFLREALRSRTNILKWQSFQKGGPEKNGSSGQQFYGYFSGAGVILLKSEKRIVLLPALLSYV